ncbi:MAG TPA: hypothetical protein VJR27_03955 [Candidatus Saccharimonadales bacterium]|nr:hypothetical protein [Candidatus Saccharimonadales bacterium]
MSSSHELTPAEQMQPPTQILEVQQPTSDHTVGNRDFASGVEQAILTQSYNAENRRANALQEQQGVPNQLARTALGRVLRGAANVGGENRVVSGRLRGTRPDGTPIFEAPEAQERRQIAQAARKQTQAQPPTPQRPQPPQNFGPQPPQEFGPRGDQYEQPQSAPRTPQRQQGPPPRHKDYYDPYLDDQRAADDERKQEALRQAQLRDPKSAASRLQRLEEPSQPRPEQPRQQPARPTDENDDFFDNPFGNSDQYRH